jgi:two-component system chemotaxis response regulator CheY
MKRVLDVGQCSPDHASIRRLIETHFEAQVVQAHGADDAFRQLRADTFDLVLINRVLDADGSDGVEIVEQIKADSKLADLPVMLVTNYLEHQERAVEAGAEPGFGKDALASPQTRQLLERFLS